MKRNTDPSRVDWRHHWNSPRPLSRIPGREPTRRRQSNTGNSLPVPNRMNRYLRRNRPPGITPPRQTRVKTISGELEHSECQAGMRQRIGQRFENDRSTALKDHACPPKKTSPRAVVAPRVKRTRTALSAERATATSVHSWKDPATFTSVASASTSASRSSNRNVNGAAKPSPCSARSPRRAKSWRTSTSSSSGRSSPKRRSPSPSTTTTSG